MMNELLISWQSLLNDLFKGSIPNSYQWENYEDIISVLDFIGNYSNTNYMFYPNGGGMTLSGAKKSNEKGCIELAVEITSNLIIKAHKLTFQSFDSDLQWAYFRIETNDLEPISDEFNLCVRENVYYEVLAELSPGNYQYYSDDLSFVRLVTRILNGSFVIFTKASIYNQYSFPLEIEPTNGIHNKMSVNEFNNHISTLIVAFEKGLKEFNLKQKNQ